MRRVSLGLGSPPEIIVFYPSDMQVLHIKLGAVVGLRLQRGAGVAGISALGHGATIAATATRAVIRVRRRNDL
jgi:hypothetical protein